MRKALAFLVVLSLAPLQAAAQEQNLFERLFGPQRRVAPQVQPQPQPAPRRREPQPRRRAAPPRQAAPGAPARAAPSPQPSPAQPAPSTETAAPAPPVEEVIPPYAGDLERLSEVIGSVHFLRGLCGGNEKDAWREDMTALLEADQPGPDRRARLMASFNRGYRGVSETHRGCTPAARVLIDRYVAEGGRLVRDITGRYGS